jgi:hypothetical protein
LIRGNFAGIKILGDGELKHGLTIEADKFSESARAKIEKAGGSATIREARTTSPQVAEETDAEAAKPVASKRATKKPAAKKKKPAAKKKPAKKR